MTKIAVIGAAGEVGSSATFNIAVHGLADEIVMIDVRENVLRHHVIDLSCALVGQRDVLLRAGSYEDLAGSQVVVMTAGVSPRLITSRNEYLHDNLPIVMDIVRKVEQFCPTAVMITATHPVDELNYAAYAYSSLGRHQLIGYSLNNSKRFRQAIAQSLELKPSQVEAAVFGEHSDAQVMVFSTVKVDGKALRLDDEAKQLIRKRVVNRIAEDKALKAGRTSGWASGVGLAAMVGAVTQNTQDVFVSSVVLDGQYGHRRVSISVPFVLGKKGIVQIQEWALTPEELRELGAAVSTFENTFHLLEDALGRKARR